MSAVIELRQRRAEAIEQMKVMNETAVAEQRDLTDDEKGKFEQIKNLVGNLAEQIERMEWVDSQVEQVERSAPAPVASRSVAKPVNYNNKTRLGDSETRAMAFYIRTGDLGALAEARAANDTIGNVGTNADGLYAVPTGHYNQIIARRDEQMLANQVGILRIPGRGLTVNVPLDGEADVEFASTGEQVDNYANAYTRDFPALGQAAMTLAKYTKKIALTEELLEDEDSNLLSFLANYVGRAMASQHNSLLLTELRAGGTAAFTLDSASTIGASEIPELVYKLQAEYADNAVWVMSRATEGVIRGLQGSDFLYVPTPAGVPGMPRPTLWGYPVFNSSSASAIAASAKSLILFNPGFVGMREGQGLTFQRDPYTTDGVVYLKYGFRAVYKVLQAEAVQYATHPTA